MNTNGKKILVIDDDLYVGNLLDEALSKEGYTIVRAYSGTEARYVLASGQPDLILLDLMLPGLSGEELFGQIKDIPVIVVSAKTDPDHKADLLLEGAADYVTKPFHLKELCARIAVQLRKAEAPQKSASVLKFEDLTLDTDTHMVRSDTASVKLTRTECAIFKRLVRNQTQIVTKSCLLDRIAMDTPDCTESSLKIHISNLRKKLRQLHDRDYIEAVWGIGFRLRSESE